MIHWFSKGILSSQTILIILNLNLYVEYKFFVRAHNLMKMTEKSILDNAIYVVNFIIFCLVAALAQMRASLATMAEPKDSNSIEWKLRTFYWSCMNMGSYVKDAISVIRRTIITDLREYSLPFSSAFYLSQRNVQIPSFIQALNL